MQFSHQGPGILHLHLIITCNSRKVNNLITYGRGTSSTLNKDYKDWQGLRTKAMRCQLESTSQVGEDKHRSDLQLEIVSYLVALCCVCVCGRGGGGGVCLRGIVWNLARHTHRDTDLCPEQGPREEQRGAKRSEKGATVSPLRHIYVWHNTHTRHTHSERGRGRERERTTFARGDVAFDLVKCNSVKVKVQCCCLPLPPPGGASLPACNKCNRCQQQPPRKPPPYPYTPHTKCRTPNTTHPHTVVANDSKCIRQTKETKSLFAILNTCPFLLVFLSDILICIMSLRTYGRKMKGKTPS